MPHSLLWHLLVAGMTLVVGLSLEVFVIRLVGPPERD